MFLSFSAACTDYGDHHPLSNYHFDQDSTASSGVLDYYRVGVTARQTGLGVGQNGVASFNIPREACPEVFITDLVPGGTYDVEVVAVSGETDSAVSSMDVSLGKYMVIQFYIHVLIDEVEFWSSN